MQSDYFGSIGATVPYEDGEKLRTHTDSFSFVLKGTMSRTGETQMLTTLAEQGFEVKLQSFPKWENFVVLTHPRKLAVLFLLVYLS